MGVAKVPLDLQVIRLQTDEQINGQSIEVTFPDPLLVVNLRFRFRQLSFPEAGEYLFQLWCDGNPICHRRISVYWRENG